MTILCMERRSAGEVVSEIWLFVYGKDDLDKGGTVVKLQGPGVHVKSTYSYTFETATGSLLRDPNHLNWFVPGSQASG